MRDFDKWLSTFTDSIFNYKYYVDFETVYSNVASNKDGLFLLSSLIGCKNPEAEFRRLCDVYPSVLRCIPILIAKREMEITAIDGNGKYIYRFDKPNYTIDQYCYFMRETGLFDLFANHIISNVVDYVMGVEAGMNSNARKNRGGDQMEDLVESFIKKLSCQFYKKEMYVEEIKKLWGLDLSRLTNNGKATKRLDFVIRQNGHVYGIETNFYGSGGSKLNETARSYKELSLEAFGIPNFTFIWITDGKGWEKAKNNLRETFDVLPTLFNIHDLENGALLNLIVK
jgi:type II restriction enzyme